MYYLISCIVLLVSFYLFKKASGSMSLTKINMISFIFYYYLLLQSFIGAVLVVNRVDKHYLISKIIANNDVRFYGWLAILYTMIAMPVSMIFTARMFKLKSVKTLFSKYGEAPIECLISPKDSYIRYPLYFLTILSVISIIYTFMCLQDIPLLRIFFKSQPQIFETLRSKATLSFPGNEYIKNIFGLVLSPVITLIAYVYWKITRSKKDLLWFGISFLGTILILTYNFEKTPIINLILGFVFLTVLIKGKIKTNRIFIIVVLIFILILCMYKYIANVSDVNVLFSYNTGIVGRLILTQIAGLFLSFNFFPTMHHFIGFSSLSQQISHLFGTEYSVRSARIIMEVVNHKGVVDGSAGVVNSLYTAEAWANFGLIGVIIAPFLVGFVIQFFYLVLLKTKKTPIFLGLFAYLSYSWPVSGGFNDFFYAPILIILLLVLILTIGFSKALKIIKNS